MMKLLVTLLLCSGLAWVQAENKTVEEGDMVVKVLGRSGTIVIHQKDNTTDEIVVKMDKITEVASDESAARKGNKHKVNSFANQDFSMTGISTTTYRSVSARHVKLTSLIANNKATLNVLLYIFKNEGDIVNDDEVIQVKKGTVKFDIELKDWQFCKGNSSDSDNACSAVDFVISIKGKDKAVKKPREKSSKNPKKKQADNYDLGNAYMQISSKVKVDDMFRNMTSGYPKLGEENKTQYFTFRFPKFNNTVLYDLAIDLKIDGGAPNGGQNANMPSMVLAVLSVAFARFLA